MISEVSLVVPDQNCAPRAIHSISLHQEEHLGGQIERKVGHVVEDGQLIVGELLLFTVSLKSLSLID